MHDPLVVAFEIKRPWPTRRNSRGWRYWPSIVTVWHREPGGADSGDVCRHYRRWQDAEDQWHMKTLHGWKFHVHHWRIQVRPLQKMRRSLLTRCAWCSGRSRKGDAVNVSHSWDGPRGHWWQGEPGLFHSDCSSVWAAHRLCLCDQPGLSYGDHGTCAFCGKFRSWRQVPDEADRLLASLPEGSRITPEIRPQVEALWSERRRRREAA